MKLIAYSVFDLKLATFERPFFMVNDAVALRAFADAIAKPSPGSPSEFWAKHPEDFSLMRVGTFEDGNGSLEGQLVVSLVTAASLVIPNLDS